jgi:hypothetical protein
LNSTKQKNGILPGQLRHLRTTQVCNEVWKVWVRWCGSNESRWWNSTKNRLKSTAQDSCIDTWRRQHAGQVMRCGRCGSQVVWSNRSGELQILQNKNAKSTARTAATLTWDGTCRAVIMSNGNSGDVESGIHQVNF